MRQPNINCIELCSNSIVVTKSSISCTAFATESGSTLTQFLPAVSQGYTLYRNVHYCIGIKYILPHLFCALVYISAAARKSILQCWIDHSPPTMQICLEKLSFPFRMDWVETALNKDKRTETFFKTWGKCIHFLPSHIKTKLKANFVSRATAFRPYSYLIILPFRHGCPYCIRQVIHLHFLGSRRPMMFKFFLIYCYIYIFCFLSFYLIIIRQYTDVYHYFQLLAYDTLHVVDECLRNIDSYRHISHCRNDDYVFTLCFHSVLLLFFSSSFTICLYYGKCNKDTSKKK